MSRAARRRKPAATLVKLDGDLTIYAAAAVQPRLLAALALARECEALARPLEVVAASDCVREVFALFALDLRLPLPATSH